jgi:uncharacterized membrane protein
MGGFTLLVAKDQLEELDMPIERAMSLAITGWVKTDSKSNSDSKINSESKSNSDSKSDLESKPNLDLKLNKETEDRNT